MNLLDKENEPFDPDCIGLDDSEYECPKCGWYPCGHSFPYTVNGVEYPICWGGRTNKHAEGQYESWNEKHCCKKCKTMFWCENQSE